MFTSIHIYLLRKRTRTRACLAVSAPAPCCRRCTWAWRLAFGEYCNLLISLFLFGLGGIGCCTNIRMLLCYDWWEMRETGNHLGKMYHLGGENIDIQCDCSFKIAHTRDIPESEARSDWLYRKGVNPGKSRCTWVWRLPFGEMGIWMVLVSEIKALNKIGKLMQFYW